MLTLTTGSATAIIVVHEIYGINRHITELCEKYHSCGYDIYCPNLLHVDEPFSYAQQEEAYASFTAACGFEAHSRVDALVRQLRPHYKKVFLLGFSVGATIAWICAHSGLCDAIVAYYGSRIRDYLALTPTCPALLIFARHEMSFCPATLAGQLEKIPHVSVKILTGAHGFSDPFAKNFHPESAHEAEELARSFIQGQIMG